MPGFEVFGEEEKREVLQVLESGILGRYGFEAIRGAQFKVTEFENAFAQYTGAKHALAVSSGSAALKVALAALGVGLGDEVITQGYTFVATWESILDAGAVPVFAEIDESLNMDPKDLEKKITAKTKAIAPVHMMGAAAKIEEIKAIADKHGIPVIEDTAQAVGARLNGQHLGTFGAIGTFSLDSVKTITTGEGGMCITNDAKLFERMDRFHDHGHDHLPNPGGRGGETHEFIGFNFRMMEIQGAIGLAQLAKLDHILAEQRKHKNLLKEAASRIPGVSFREMKDPAGDSATFFTFMLPDKARADKAAGILQEAGVAPTRWSENAWHYYPNWEHLLNGSSPCKNGWPFMENGKKRHDYTKNALPQTMGILERALTWQVPVKLADERRAALLAGLEKVAKGM